MNVYGLDIGYHTPTPTAQHTRRVAAAANPVDMDRPVYLGTRAATAVAAAAAAAAATVAAAAAAAAAATVAAAAAATVAAAAARIPDEVLKQIFGGLHSCIGRSIARRFRTPFRGPRTPVSSLTAGQFKWAVLHGGLPLSVLLSRFLASRICGGSAAWRFEDLRWVCGLGCPCSEDVCCYAAAAGRLDVLRWARAQDPPCPWGFTCRRAAGCGHLALLQWARAQDPPCPWDEAGVVHCAAWGGHLAVLKWARAQGVHTNWNDVCWSASARGHLAVLQWAQEQGYGYWGPGNCDVAAQNGHLAVLQWLRAQDPPCAWDQESVCLSAARYGHWHVRRWVLEATPRCPAWAARDRLNARLDAAVQYDDDYWL
jgi:hypothetical protein